MVTLVDIQQQLEKNNQQLLKVLSERVQLYSQHDVDEDLEAELQSLLVEEAADYGLDEGKVEKIGKLMNAMCRSSKE